jgi:hypothetical protein
MLEHNKDFFISCKIMLEIYGCVILKLQFNPSHIQFATIDFFI